MNMQIIIKLFLKWGQDWEQYHEHSEFSEDFFLKTTESKYEKLSV